MISCLDFKLKSGLMSPGIKQDRNIYRDINKKTVRYISRYRQIYNKPESDLVWRF